MKKVAFGLLVASAACFSACTSKTSTTSTTTDSTHVDSVPAPVLVAPEYNSPEGVATDGEFLYVSNLGVKAEAMVKDGDGRIMKISLAADNWIDKDKWAAIKLDAPKGLAVIGKQLYATDIDHVVVIDLATATQVETIDFSSYKTQFLNDLAVRDDSTLLVSATDINTIFQINTHTKAVTKMKTGALNGPNGLLYSSEDGKVYCVEYGAEKKPGRVVAIDAGTGAVKVLGEYKGGLDGLGRTSDGALMFSDWATAHLQKMDVATGKVTEVASDSLQGPADFYYDAASHKTYLPCMLANKLAIIEGN